MGTCPKAVLAAILTLGILACGALAAEAYEGPIWTINKSEVPTNVSVKSKNVGPIVFEHTGGLFGNSKQECNESDEGTIGREGKDQVTKISISGCKLITSLCTEALTVKALHLPWNTQLEEVEGEARDKIKSESAPAWEVECPKMGIKVVCEGETTTGIENTSSEVGVELLFDSLSATLSCTDGGKATVKGSDLTENLPEQQIRVLKATFLTFNPNPLHFKKVLNTPEDILITYVGPFKQDKLEAQSIAPAANYRIVKPNKCEKEIFVKRRESCVIEVEMTAAGAAKGTLHIETSIQPESSLLEEV